jgi:CheY-like chemotaxis protein
MSSSGVVLVVDDEELNRKLLRELLTSRGFHIEEARDGEEALHKARQLSPDIILLDVRMPRINGFEACRELKQDPRTQLIPVVLLTALSSVEDRVAGIESGADDFLSKPFHQAELVARVRSLIHMKQLIDQLERTENILFTMAAAVEAKDPYTEGHLRRLADLFVRDIDRPGTITAYQHGRSVRCAPARYRQDRHPGRHLAQGGNALTRGVRRHQTTPRVWGAHLPPPSLRGRGRADRPKSPRTLEWDGVSRRPCRRGDSSRSPHRRRRGRLRCDDDGPALSPGRVDQQRDGRTVLRGRQPMGSSSGRMLRGHYGAIEQAVSI